MSIALLIASLGVLLAAIIQTTDTEGPLGARPVDGLPVGATAPPLKAQGWVNGTAPTPEDLEGEVYVVDIWATWCMPCKLYAPTMVRIQEHYKDKVKFIGLTAQSPSNNPELMREIDQFLSDTGIKWVNGYGALDTVEAFECNLIPETWVVGRDGRIIWNHNSPGNLAEGIELALKGVDPDTLIPKEEEAKSAEGETK